MQDSLEDYIKLANNVNTSTVRTESSGKENELTSDARALKIVEFAIDGQLRPEVFIKCLNYINPSFYQDIVEERHIAEYCGYPICGYKVLHKPHKQYFISSKTNKIYDITERKHFCSNFCYKASNHIKEQIESSPLWLRTEQNPSKFRLLLAKENGIPGEEILILNKAADESTFTSVVDFAEASLSEVQDNELTTEFKRLVIDKNSKEKTGGLDALHTINIAHKYAAENKSQDKKYKSRDASVEKSRRYELVKEVKTEVVENCKSLDKRLKMALDKVKKMKENGIQKKSLLIETAKNPEIIKPISEPKEACDKAKLASVVQEKNIKSTELSDNYPVLNMDNIFHCFTSWTTLDTFLFLHGEDRIRKALTERKLTEMFDRLRVSELSIAQQVRYRDICRRMHTQDMMEKRRDGDLMDGRKCVRRKPLPEYGDLKKESKALTVKVKAFLSGTAYDPNPSTIKVDQLIVKERSRDTAQGSGRADEDIPAVLPLVDNSSPSAMRRRIFLNSANPQVCRHLLALHLDDNLTEEIRHLVNTFQLSSKNIVFKPREWKLIGIALLEILSIRNEVLHNYLRSDIYNEYILSEFSSVLDFKDYIIGIKNYLQNVELFIELYISSDK